MLRRKNEVWGDRDSTERDYDLWKYMIDYFEKKSGYSKVYKTGLGMQECACRFVNTKGTNLISISFDETWDDEGVYISSVSFAKPQKDILIKDKKQFLEWFQSSWTW